MSKAKQDYQSKLDKKFGKSEYKLVGAYISCTEPTKIKHSCGLTTTTRPRFLIRGQATCKCLSKRGQYQTPGYNRKVYQTRLDKKFGKNEYLLLKGYQDYHTPIRIKHSCGKVFSIAPKHIMNGRGCECIRKQQRIDDRTIRLAKEKLLYQAKLDAKFGKDAYRIKGDYHGCIKHSRIKHSCGQIFKAWPINLLRESGVCPCQNRHLNGLLATQSDYAKHRYQARLHKKYGDNKYIIIGDYLGYKKKHKILHSCGHTFKVTLDKLSQGEESCPMCFPRCYGPEIKLVIVGKHVFMCQGNEPKSLHLLLKKYKPSQIQSSLNKILKFDYKFEGKTCRYTPDFFVVSANLVVETKSTISLGLLPSHYDRWESYFERNQAKARAVLRKGYKFQLDLFNGDKQLKLPSDWMIMPKADVAAALGLTLRSG